MKLFVVPFTFKSDMAMENHNVLIGYIYIYLQMVGFPLSCYIVFGGALSNWPSP